jgi:hypothetical protein
VGHELAQQLVVRFHHGTFSQKVEELLKIRKITSFRMD